MTGNSPRRRCIPRVQVGNPAHTQFRETDTKTPHAHKASKVTKVRIPAGRADQADRKVARQFKVLVARTGVASASSWF